MIISPEVKKAIEDLIDAICAIPAATRGRHVRKMTDMFMDLVDKEEWPDYYQAIPEPRSINGIRANLAKGKYKSAEDVYEDLILVMLNAEFYNEEGSQIWQDARTLKSHIEQNWKDNKLLPEPRTTPLTTSPQKRKQMTKNTITLPPAASALNTPLKFVQPSIPTPPIQTSSTMATSSFKPSPLAMQQPSVYAFPATPAPTASTSKPNYYPNRHQSADADGDSPDPSHENAARDAQSDEIVRQLERGLPRWGGPGDKGWINELPNKLTFSDIMDRIKDYKYKGKCPADALIEVPEDPVSEASFTSALSFRIIDTRSRQNYYETTSAFDLEMTHFFEKARRYHEPGTPAYGNVLTCQRLYQQFTSPAPPKLPPQSSTHFASVPAGPGTAKPLHSADSTSEDGVTTFRVSSKDRTFTDEINYKGMTYKLADWVHLMNPDDPSKPIIAQIFKTWISEESSKKGQLGITACWYYRPEQTFHPETRKFWEREVFKTGHFADHAVEDIIEKIAVQFTARHIRGRPRPPYWYPGWPLYVCDSRYNDRERIFVKIKNWNSCVPDEVRKKPDWMPIYPFENMVFPRRFNSPFLKGVAGPGGLGEGIDGDKNDAGRKRTRRATEKAISNAAAASTSSAPPLTGFYGGNAAGSSTQGPSYQIAVPAATTPPSKSNEDRSVITAAGGMANITSLEKLPPETIKYFDRDPDTNEVLWFSGPPIDIPRPRAPQYSLAYLHFLAKKAKRAREGGKGDEDGPSTSEESSSKRPRKMYWQIVEEAWDHVNREAGLT